MIKDIKIHSCVSTLRKLTSLASKLGVAWYPAKRDLEDNANKIDVYRDPPFSWKHMGTGFVKEYCLYGENCYTREGGLVLSSIWALRGMRTMESFCKDMIQCMQKNPDAPMGDSVVYAYNESLKEHQNVFMRVISSGVVLASTLDKTPAWKQLDCSTSHEGSAVLEGLLLESSSVSVSMTAFLKKAGIDETTV